MGKKTITGTKNVYELAQERLKVIFNEFDKIGRASCRERV